MQIQEYEPSYRLYGSAVLLDGTVIAHKSMRQSVACESYRQAENVQNTLTKPLGRKSF